MRIFTPARLWLAPVGLCLLLSLAPDSSGQPAGGSFHLSIRDKANGQVVPAMICITSLADNTWRVPPDGMTAAPFMRNLDIIAGRQKSIEYIARGDKKWFVGD